MREIRTLPRTLQDQSPRLWKDGDTIIIEEALLEDMCDHEIRALQYFLNDFVHRAIQAGWILHRSDDLSTREIRYRLEWRQAA